MGFCGECGAAMDADARFCPNCGSKQGAAAAPPPVERVGSRIGVGGDPQKASNACHRCNDIVFLNEAWKSAKHAYHEKCFNCLDCGVRLKLENYKSISGEIFCMKCYTAENGKPFNLRRKFNQGDAPATPKSPSTPAAARLGGGGQKCHACDKTVYDLERVRSSTNVYHKECFKCLDCGLLLSENIAKGVQGEVFCDACYTAEMGKLPHERRDFGKAKADGVAQRSAKLAQAAGGAASKLGGASKTCPTCQKAVYENEKLVAAGAWFHSNSDCFRCVDCKVPLLVSTYKGLDGVAYCEPCFTAKMIALRPKGYQPDFKGFYAGDEEKAKWEDSNVAGIGGKENRDLRKAAAETEVAWKDAGKAEGLQIWRIEKFHVKAWPKGDYGQFFRGDSYIILQTYKKDPAAEKLCYNLFFWLGRDSTQDEQGTAAYKTVELDDLLGDVPVQCREVDGAESAAFLAAFGGQITVNEGGIESGFNYVQPESYRPRLLHCKGKPNAIRVEEVPCQASSLNQGDVFLLDAGLQIYEWHGRLAGVAERNKARDIRIGLVDRRNGRPKSWVIDMDDPIVDHVADFWKLLGSPGGVEYIAPATPDVVPPYERVLLQLSDASGKLVLSEVSRGKNVARNQLDSADVFILDVGETIYVWVGNGTTKQERTQALPTAMTYLKEKGRPLTVPLVRVLEASPNADFIGAFDV
jgi:gelsolin